MKLNTIAEHLPDLPQPLHYKVYLATLQQTPVVVIEILSSHPDQPKDLPLYSALLPLTLLPDIDFDQPSLKPTAEFLDIQSTFQEYIDLYNMV